jgi:hypothetical protein
MAFILIALNYCTSIKFTVMFKYAKWFGDLKYRWRFLCLLWFVLFHEIVLQIYAQTKICNKQPFSWNKESRLAWGGLSFILIARTTWILCLYKWQWYVSNKGVDINDIRKAGLKVAVLETCNVKRKERN